MIKVWTIILNKNRQIPCLTDAQERQLPMAANLRDKILSPFVTAVDRSRFDKLICTMPLSELQKLNDFYHNKLGIAFAAGQKLKR